MDVKTIVIEDANIWISFLVGSDYGALIDALDDPDFKFLICPELIDELRNVTARPKFRKWFTEDFANDLISVLESKCISIQVENKPQPLMRDPKDAYLLNLAEQGHADILVSNDNDITSLKGKIDGLEIFTLAEFMVYYSNRKK